MKGFGGAVAYRYLPRLNTIFLNITNRCANSCSFCVRNSNPGLSGYRLWLDREPTDDETWNAFKDEVKASDREVVWCGFGEPTIRLDTVLGLTKRIRQDYPNLKVRLDTDGLAGLRNAGRNVAKELSEAGIYYVSISLNAENQEKYERLCRPSLPRSYQGVLDFARDCRKHISHVRLTVVNLEAIDISKCREIAEDLGCDFEVRG
jgi:cyclic pyranopterin phosphate synthase